MADRYIIVDSLASNCYQKGVPILISGGNLLRDSLSNKLYVQLKLQSLSEKMVHAVQVSIHVNDDNGNLVESKIFCYDKINAERDQFFGTQDAIPLDGNSGTAFSVAIDSVTYIDGLVSFANVTNCIRLPERLPLIDKFSFDKELEKQYQLENGNNHIYLPKEVSDLWLCSCGAINHIGEESCHNCGISYETAIHTDFEGLSTRKSAREASNIAKKKSRNKKLKQIAIILGSATLTAAIVASLIFYLIVPMNRYNKASEAIRNGDYKTAYSLLQQNGSFKDSKDKANELLKNYWTQEYNRILTEGFEEQYYDDLYISPEEVTDQSTLFAIAYIDNDDVPELLVAVCGEYCCIFTLQEGNNSFGDAHLVNSYLTRTPDGYSEIGYFEHGGYVYCLNAESDYRSDFWCNLGPDNDDQDVKFVRYSDTYGNDTLYTDFIIMYSDGSEVPVDEESFYAELEKYIDTSSYKEFNLYNNNKSNRQDVLYGSDQS